MSTLRRRKRYLETNIFLNNDARNDTFANGDTKSDQNYQCISCKNIWNDKTCVVTHVIQNTEFNFCLNCDDWVKEKGKIFDQGWSLTDKNGYLRRDI